MAQLFFLQSWNCWTLELLLELFELLQVFFCAGISSSGGGGGGTGDRIHGQTGVLITFLKQCFVSCG